MKNKKQIVFLFLTLALFAAGCTTTPQQQDADSPPRHAKRVQVAMYDPTIRPKTTHLDVYDTKPPQRPYKAIALLTCEGTPKEEAAMTTAILYRARMMGADAVMSADTAFIQEGGGFIFVGHGGIGKGIGTHCIFRASAIVYEDK